MKALAATMLILTLHSPSAAGPFDLEMGMTLKDLQAIAPLRPDGTYRFITKTLPAGHPELFDYGLTITPPHGLCKVSASTVVITTSANGMELQQTFNRLFGALTDKYGAGKRYDQLRSSSALTGVDDWLMALLRKERTLQAFWMSQDHLLPDNLAGIMLEGVAAGPSHSFVSLSYEFKNSTECLDWARARRANPL